MRAVVLVMLAGCWRTTAPTTEPPVSDAPVGQLTVDPPRLRATPPDVSQINPRPVSFRQGSPGPLAAGHAVWDAASACSVCHSDTQPDVPRAKCLACHASIASRINAQRGLHATAQVSGKACEACHNDHKGRRFDLMGWRGVPGGRARFDHALTGWAVPSGYDAARCTRCHVTLDRQGLSLFLDANRTQFP